MGIFHDTVRGHGRPPSETEPSVMGTALIQVCHVCLSVVLAVEQVSQDHHLIPLLSIPQKLAHRQSQELAQQVQQGAFHCRLRVHHEFQVAQVQLLKPLSVIAARDISIVPDAANDTLIFTDCLSHHKGDIALKDFCYIIPAMDLPDSRAAGIIRDNDDIPGEQGPMGPAQG